MKEVQQGPIQMEEGQQQQQRPLARPKYRPGVGQGPWQGIPKERLQEMLSTREAIKAIKLRGHSKLKPFAETLPQETQEAALLHPLISRVGTNPRHLRQTLVPLSTPTDDSIPASPLPHTTHNTPAGGGIGPA